MESVTLPPGVKVYVRGQKYTGEIPKSVCPKKYLDGGKPSTPKSSTPSEKVG